ncbi:MAG TPA: dephospho-CoA kinase [Candidatus Omnitrophota bacterium]|nr:dephospho-CoA kinase [Candidatus Omnitrophota bacterium]
MALVSLFGSAGLLAPFLRNAVMFPFDYHAVKMLMDPERKEMPDFYLKRAARAVSRLAKKHRVYAFTRLLRDDRAELAAKLLDVPVWNKYHRAEFRLDLRSDAFLREKMRSAGVSDTDAREKIALLYDMRTAFPQDYLVERREKRAPNAGFLAGPIVHSFIRLRPFFETIVRDEFIGMVGNLSLEDLRKALGLMAEMNLRLASLGIYAGDAFRDGVPEAARNVRSFEEFKCNLQAVDWLYLLGAVESRYWKWLSEKKAGSIDEKEQKLAELCAEADLINKGPAGIWTHAYLRTVLRPDLTHKPVHDRLSGLVADLYVMQGTQQWKEYAVAERADALQEYARAHNVNDSQWHILNHAVDLNAPVPPLQAAAQQDGGKTGIPEYRLEFSERKPDTVYLATGGERSSWVGLARVRTRGNAAVVSFWRTYPQDLKLRRGRIFCALLENEFSRDPAITELIVHVRPNKKTGKPCRDVVGFLRSLGFRGPLEYDGTVVMAKSLLPGAADRAFRTPRIIGVAGYIGSAKTTVCTLIEREVMESVRIIHMDAIGHEVRADPGMIQKIVQRFGAGVLAPDGAVDRKKLGAIVFGDESQRRALNAIMFEPMKERALAGIAQAKRSGKAMIVIEAAVLNEMKELDDLCDEIWLIDADQSVRHSRLAARGLSREQIGDIEARQKPALDALRGDPRTRIIDNNGSIEALHERVRQLLRSPAAKDGGLGAPAERACAAEVRGLYRIYKQEIDEGMDRKDVKKIAIGFFRSYTVDPCAAVLTGKDDAAVYAQTRFYYSHISLARRLKEYFFRVQSAMRMMHASACSRQAKKMMLPGFRAFIRCLATNLEVNIETVIYPLGENRTDDYGTLDVGYDPQGRLSQITITMPDNSPDAEFHDLAMVLQLFIIRIMHQRGILSREQDILAALPQYYYGERVESPLSHYIDSGISFPLDKVQFEMFLFQLIVDALEVEYGGSVYFTDKEFYRIAEEQERAIQRTRMFCEPFRDGGKDPDAVKLDSLLEHLKGRPAFRRSRLLGM